MLVLNVIWYRSIKYRHRYSTEISDKNDHAMASQEAFGSDSLDPDSEKIDNGEACLTSLDNEVTGELTAQYYSMIRLDCILILSFPPDTSNFFLSSYFLYLRHSCYLFSGRFISY